MARVSTADESRWQGAQLHIHEGSGVMPLNHAPAPGYEIHCTEGHQHLLTVRPVQSDAERRAAFGIRYRAYCGPGRDFPASRDGIEDGQEYDAYDASAILVLASLDGAPVGTVRATFLLNDRFLLETFEQDGVAIIPFPASLPRSKTSEPSRMVVDHDALPKCIYSPLISTALFHRIAHESRAAGMTHWVFEANARNLRAIHRLQWKIQPMGEPLTHHGQQFWAFWMSLEPENFTWELGPPP